MSWKKLIFYSFAILLIITGYEPGFAKKSPKHSPLIGPDLGNALQWRCVGPYRGGRVIAVTGHPTDKMVFYFGGCGSGVWKTTNGGKNWKNVSDGFFQTSSVGALAISTSNPNILYAGMGECCLRGNISHGDGIYKTVNGGKTWTHAGLEKTRHIARIRIHPRNPDILYVAALGHAFGPNRERGIFKSTDGGKSWKKVLFVSPNTGAIDVILKPGEPDTLFAALWQVQRYPYKLESGGPESSVFKSTNAGGSWQRISDHPGFPQGIKGRIGLTVSRARPDRVWAIVEAEKSGIYVSEDDGISWTFVTNNANLLQRPWYYSHIKADPVNPDKLYVMNVRFWKSNDAGKTYNPIRVPHGDNHDLWIDPNDPQRMIEGNDGGATVSFDGGKTWSSIYNQPTAQFYHVTTDAQFPYRIYGAQQDNSTLAVPSRSGHGAIPFSECYSVGGCESGYIAVDPRNADIIYAGCYGGMLTRYDHGRKHMTDISVWPDNPMGAGAIDLKYRFQWTFPIVLSPHDPDVLYTAANYLFKTLNQGHSWEKISPDLTRNDSAKLLSSGGPLAKDNTSVEYYGTIFAFAESPIKKDLLWTGSDDGLVYLSRDGGKNWVNVTPKNLPEWALISIIEPSHFDPGTAYLAATKYKSDDYSPYLYKTENYGKSWIRITRGIKTDDFTRVIREYPGQRNVLFAGTENGVYLSRNGGRDWFPFNQNLPVTPIHDLVIHNNDLIAATHGRSFWVLDDLSKVSQVLEIQSNPRDFLFKPRKTVRSSGWYQKNPVNAGKSLPVGVIINYYLNQQPKDPIYLTIKEKNGQVVQRFSSKPGEKELPPIPAKKGFNQFTWDFLYPEASKVKGAFFWFAWGRIAPKAPPGEYRVELKTGDKILARNFEILVNPGLPTTAEDYREQFNLVSAIRDKLTETHDSIKEIRNIRTQLKGFLARIKDTKYIKPLENLSSQMLDKLSKIEDELIQYRAKAVQDLLNYPIKLNNKLAALAMVVLQSDSKPTRQAYQVFEDLKARINTQLTKLKSLIANDLAEFNQKVIQEKIPFLTLKYLK